MIQFRRVFKQRFQRFQNFQITKYSSLIDDTYARQILSDSEKFLSEKKYKQAIEVLQNAKDDSFEEKFRGIQFKSENFRKRSRHSLHHRTNQRSTSTISRNFKKESRSFEKIQLSSQNLSVST
jgi:hypothetical protein